MAGIFRCSSADGDKCVRKIYFRVASKSRFFVCESVGGWWFFDGGSSHRGGSEETSEQEPVQGIVFVCAVWIWLTVVDGLWGSILDAILKQQKKIDDCQKPPSKEENQAKHSATKCSRLGPPSGTESGLV